MKTEKLIQIDPIDRVRLLTKKSPGWNARRDLPATITLDGGCEVHAVPAWLWTPRIKPYVERFDTRPTPMRRVGGTR